MHQTPDRKGDQAVCGRDSVYCALCSDLYLSRDTVASGQCPVLCWHPLLCCWSSTEMMSYNLG